MTRPAQQATERHFVRMFLADRYAHDNVVSPPRGVDHPDVWVMSGGVPALAIEVREYHPEPFRAEVEARWGGDAELGSLIEDASRAEPELATLDLTVAFRDDRLPPHPLHRPLADELVRLAGHVARGWLAEAGDWVVVYTEDERVCVWSEPSAVFRLDELPPADWPLVFAHVRQLDARRHARRLRSRWACPQANVAMVALIPAEFRRMIAEKDRKLREAIRRGKFDPREAPAWLLIVCNLGNDLSSCGYDAIELTRLREDLKADDFGELAFEQVWLMAADRHGDATRLHPPG